MSDISSRNIICADTAVWLKGIDSLDSVITSLPDKEETNMDLEQWESWFVDIVREILRKTQNYAIFYQTDRKINGKLLDKSFLLNKAADLENIPIIFHKIILRRDVGKIDLFRPTYTHLLCFSKNNSSGKAVADVIESGKMIYKDAMGENAVELSCNFIKNNSNSVIIYDLFCGQGTVLAIAENHGFMTIGVEILPSQCEKARNIKVTKSNNN